MFGTGRFAKVVGVDVWLQRLSYVGELNLGNCRTYRSGRNVISSSKTEQNCALVRL